MSRALENYQFQKSIFLVTIFLFIVKIIAWYITQSIAILTDTLEYSINVIASLVGMYSLKLSAKPRDENHPYGHGKVEFLSSTLEGILMIFTSLIILVEAIYHLLNQQDLQKVDYGILLVALTGIVNYFMGKFAIAKGKKNNSLALIASGKHIISDTYATIGIVVGLILIYFFHYSWIDSAIAIIFSIIIIVSGYNILRESIAGIMDEADLKLLTQVISELNKARNENWIDLHNFRIIKYGSILHVDCHLTVPYFLNVHEAHDEVDKLERFVKNHFEDNVELFVHLDGCMDFSCKICTKADCPVRKFPFQQKIEWNLKNVLSNSKHRLN